MAKRSFSFLLARRYLNPKRAMLSSFTLISLIGVLLGVLVLVVVMAVYAGMERDVKSRLLGFTPHLLMRGYSQDLRSAEVVNWRESADKMAAVPGVQSALPFIADHAILDVESIQRPIFFYGLDTENRDQMEGISRMLDKDHFPQSSADMGLDDQVVISSTLADQLKLRPGDPLRLYSTRNFDSIVQAYKSTENPPIRVYCREDWEKVKSLVLSGWKREGTEEGLKLESIAQAQELLGRMIQQRIRGPERELLEQIAKDLESGEPNEKAGLAIYTAESKQSLEATVAELGQTDPEKMDANVLKDLKSLVLPKEVKVIGVYQASQMNLNTPDVFVPLGMAQTLAGLSDGVQGISLRLNDPYQAKEMAARVNSVMGPDWESLSWMDQYSSFFALISQQRVMMYFALSFIVLVSAFSMMAVMFTVTIQKRREIGVMKALGAAPGQIVRVFLYQGMILGVLGACVGVFLGRVVIHYRGGLQSVLRGMGFDPFSAGFTGFTVLPAYNDPKEQVSIAILAFVLCSLAALVPAAFAARSDAAKSLRNL